MANSMSRRKFLAVGGAAVTGAMLLPGRAWPAAAPGYTLPALPYAADALEPVIDTRTMQIHHGKHHAGYVRKLNAALEGLPDLQGKPLDQLLARGAAAVPVEKRQAVINNGGGHANHSLFWQVLAPASQTSAPGGKLAAAIASGFGSVENLQERIVKAGAKRFGSGWVWLTRDARGALEVSSSANQDSPHLLGKTPIFGIDVWEHAYYLNYQNRRGDYLKAIWKIVNWDAVTRNYLA